MREILFKGKRIDNGEWVEGYLSKSRLIGYADNKLQFCIDCEDGGIMISSIIVPDTFGQYIGQMDKNGTKIFEGDIIKHYYDKRFPEKYNLHTIEWDNDRCKFIGKFYSDGIMEFIKIWADYQNNYEVIGNIHDNPELLKQIIKTVWI